MLWCDWRKLKKKKKYFLLQNTEWRHYTALFIFITDSTPLKINILQEDTSITVSIVILSLLPSLAFEFQSPNGNQRRMNKSRQTHTFCWVRKTKDAGFIVSIITLHATLALEATTRHKGKHKTLWNHLNTHPQSGLHISLVDTEHRHAAFATRKHARARVHVCTCVQLMFFFLLCMFLFSLYAQVQL